MAEYETDTKLDGPRTKGAANIFSSKADSS